jgi:hypothetical protein
VSQPATSQHASPSILARVFAIFSSFGLASLVLLLLLLVTFLGTLEQLDHGLLVTQVKYFESFFITEIDMTCCLRAMHWPWGVTEGWTLPVILPGGYLLMIVLAVNMICGGIIRLKNEFVWLVKLPLRVITGRFSELTPAPRRVGVLISHFSIVFMLVAGVVSLYLKKEGAVWVREGRTVSEFQSFHDSVIEIERVRPPSGDGKRSVMVIPGSQFMDLTAGKARTFSNANLPFDLVVMNYFNHCAPTRDASAGPMNVDGYRLQEVSRKNPMTGKALEHENFMNGAYVKVVNKQSQDAQTGIIWRGELAPWTVKVGDEDYTVSIGRRTYPLPFEVTLEKFIREVHPGTGQARRFSSQVIVKHEGLSGDGESKLISMNQPLRHGGFAFFQSSFDAEAADHGGTQASMFQVVSNPSDNWPLYSLIAAGTGMLIHFIWSLVRFIKRENKSPPVA